MDNNVKQFMQKDNGKGKKGNEIQMIDMRYIMVCNIEIILVFEKW